MGLLGPPEGNTAEVNLDDPFASLTALASSPPYGKVKWKVQNAA